MDRPETSKTQRDFLRVARLGTSLAFGITGGVLAGVTHSGSGLVLEFNFWVIPAALLGAGVAWAYWHFILTRIIDHQSAVGSRRFLFYTVLLVLGGLLCFLYPIRYVTRGALSDVLQGVVMAFLVVGMIGLLIWSVARLLNQPPPPPRNDDEEL